MEKLSRVRLYQTLMDDANMNGINQDIVAPVNVTILSKLEEMFLTSDIQEEGISRGPDIKTVLDLFEENLESIPKEGQVGNDQRVESLCDELKKLLVEYRNKSNKKTNPSRNFFNRLIKLLSEFNQKMIIDRDRIESFERKDRPQVFLSHAYDDRLYTYALYKYFYEQGIYLYVDWMHADRFDNGVELKANLQRELLASSQLLFMRTINSELNIQGKHMLRSWCAWELGNFYHSVCPDEKYLLNLYSVDQYENLQLHGLKIFTGIVEQKLEGVTFERDSQ